METINALKNPSFDNGLDFWTLSDNNNIILQNNGGISNGPCAYMNATSSLASLRQYIPLAKGSFTVRAKVKKVSGIPDAWIQVQCNGNTFNSPSSATKLSEDGFIDISLSFNHSSKDWQYAAIFFCCSGGAVLLDEAELNAPEDTAIHLLKYGKINATDVKIRVAPKSNSIVIAYAPLGRLMVVRETSNYDWLECRCRVADKSSYVQAGYIMRKFLDNLCNADDADDSNYENVKNRIHTVGLAECNINNVPQYMAAYYVKDLQEGAWCHYFADWISTACFWGDLSEANNNVPFKANCRDGILWFLKNSAFSFTSVEQKKKLRLFDDFSSFISEDTLTSKEENFSPAVGDYIYFSSNDSTEAAQHVGIISKILSNNYIEILDGNFGKTESTRKVSSRKFHLNIGGDADVVGIGRPLYYHYG